MLKDSHRILQLFICFMLLLLGCNVQLYAQDAPKTMPIVEEKTEYDALTNRYIIRTYVG